MSQTLQATAICDYWVSKLGLGFHPDNRAEDYDALTEEEMADYEEDMNTLFSLGLDPYEYGLTAMRAAGLI
jgi:hypothetical protein